MRRPLALASTVCLLALTACTGTSSGSDGSAETVEELAEEGLSGLALLHRGFGGGDPETDQVLVFHDPETGRPAHRIALPDGAVDPVAPNLHVHSQFSEDWTFFAYATTEPNAVHVAVLTEHGEDGAEGSGTEEPDAEGSGAAEVSYQPVESVTPSANEVLSQPVIHGDRLWFVSDNTQDGAPPQVLSVPLDAPTGTPNQEGSLPFGPGQRPSDWSLTPDGALHIRNSVPTRQKNASGTGSLVVRETAGSVVNATLNIDGGQWQTFDGSLVWGEGTALLRPDVTGGGEAPAGAYLVTVEGEGHTATRLLEESDGPVVQYAPSPERDAVLLQTGEAWFRVDLEEGAVAEAEEVFPRFHDASLNGWPLVVRWVREPVAADPSAAPPTEPSGTEGGGRPASS
ncbi:hypothetical protein A6A08_15190 [Nocardiopsis sp. TSRI0078]|uniref:hypothetical protein n=1 Tax=unclassified Nocardiopsis TaxID=2649073 RepID=UPI00093D3231|nr:hypothetical protein [Nocardiopsis sp. TSRI0078]OKI13626.1 hypothetical protein A6A08_15190 [Nocardiopsis sp. TSRI0078]